jgi:hypothetical protein
MSAGRIYLLEENGSLQSLSERPYANEDLLQALLAHYPDLLAGEQMNEEDVTGRWSLDHLFLDQDGIPTLVEVKRSTDTRIRREVVGQMLDYAANAVVYWPTETVRARFEALCDVQGDDATLLVAELISADPDDDGVIEAFWDHVKTNLRAGRIRLVFVADEIPVQLKRIVEFLNEQMNPAEVLAVEIKQYVGQGIKTLVPKVVGQTAEAQRAKSSGSRAERQWDEPSFFQELEARRGADEARVARQILDWADSTLGHVWWGRGARSGSFVPTLPHKGRNHQLFAVWTYGTVEIYFYWYQSKPPFDSEEKRRELLDRLNAIPGVSLPPDAIGRRPGIPLAVLTDEAALEQLLAVLGWVAEEIQST